MVRKKLTLSSFVLLLLFLTPSQNALVNNLKKHEQYWEQINEFVETAYQNGENQKGIRLAKKAYQYARQHLGKEHPYTLISMNYLALFYKSQGRYAEAEPLLKESLQLSAESLGKEHAHTLEIMINLAGLYKSQGRYAEAEPLYKETIRRQEKVLGKEHPSTLISMGNLAVLYKSQGRHGEAEQLYKEAIHLSERVLGKEHPDTLKIQINYIRLVVEMKKAGIALRLFKQMESQLLSRSFQELYSTTTERVRKLYLETISDFQDNVLSFAFINPKIAHQQYAANVILRWKQIYAQETAFQHRLLRISRDAEIVAMKEKVNRLRSSLSRQMYHRQSGIDMDTLWNELNLTEQQIRDAARKLKPSLEVIGVGLDQVIGRLPKDSVLIEFKRYKRTDFNSGEKTKIRLAAYLLTSDIEAEQQMYFKDLGSEEELIKALDISEKNPERAYSFLLGKFDQQIQNTKTLYIAPDGFLNLISFAAMRLPDGRYLVQRQQVNRLQTGRDLLISPKNSSSNELIAFGGVDYGELAGGTTRANTEIAELPDHYLL